LLNLHYDNEYQPFSETGLTLATIHGEMYALV